jgi:hypothetical protein
LTPSRKRFGNAVQAGPQLKGHPGSPAIGIERRQRGELNVASGFEATWAELSKKVEKRKRENAGLGISRAVRDLVVLMVASVAMIGISIWFDPIKDTISWAYRHENWRLDDILTAATVLLFASGVYSFLRWRELKSEIARRAKAQEHNRILVRGLEDAVTEVRTLRGLLQICESCKRIRDRSGSWVETEVYVQSERRVKVFHGLCPECARRLYGAMRE